MGAEFGATTGRRRRCGWLDLVVLRHAVRVNGITGLALLKLDVLTGLPEVKVCIGYRADGKELNDFPASVKLLERCEPIYRSFPGWSESIEDARSLDDLPQADDQGLVEGGSAGKADAALEHVLGLRAGRATHGVEEPADPVDIGQRSAGDCGIPFNHSTAGMERAVEAGLEWIYGSYSQGDYDRVSHGCTDVCPGSFSAFNHRSDQPHGGPDRGRVATVKGAI